MRLASGSKYVEKGSLFGVSEIKKLYYGTKEIPMSNVIYETKNVEDVTDYGKITSAATVLHTTDSVQKFNIKQYNRLNIHVGGFCGSTDNNFVSGRLLFDGEKDNVGYLTKKQLIFGKTFSIIFKPTSYESIDGKLSGPISTEFHATFVLNSNFTFKYTCDFKVINNVQLTLPIMRLELV